MTYLFVSLSLSPPLSLSLSHFLSVSCVFTSFPSPAAVNDVVAWFKSVGHVVVKTSPVSAYRVIT